MQILFSARDGPKTVTKYSLGQGRVGAQKLNSRRASRPAVTTVKVTVTPLAKGVVYLHTTGSRAVPSLQVVVFVRTHPIARPGESSVKPIVGLIKFSSLATRCLEAAN